MRFHSHSALPFHITCQFFKSVLTWSELCASGKTALKEMGDWRQVRIYSVTQVRKKWMSELGWWWGGGKERNERYIKGGKWPGKVIGWDSGSTDYGELVIIKHGLYQRKEPSWISIVWKGALEMMKRDLSSQWQRIYTLVQEWVRQDPQWKILSGENLVGITEMILDPVALRIASNKGTVDMRCCWSTTYFPVWKQSPFFTVKQEQLTTLLPWPPEWAITRAYLIWGFYPPDLGDLFKFGKLARKDPI